MTAPIPEANPPALAVVGVSKHYGATLALDDVSFELPAGEIHCLLGENGAGKSTLVKIIAGLEVQDRGVLTINGGAVEGGGVAAARAAGVGVVYQHPVVFPDIDVTENIYAGRPILRGGRIPIVDTRRMRDAVRAIFRRMDVRIDPAARMGDLSAGERQLVEIARPSPRTSASSSSMSRRRRCPRRKSRPSSPSSAASPPAASPSCSSRTASTKSSRSATGSRCCGMEERWRPARSRASPRTT
jgi:ABC-type iron transport system FetAB ATPase subunit